MPAKDTYHDHVRAALEADGWTITHDPFRLDFGERIMHADLAATRGAMKIIVEIKTVAGESPVTDLHSMIGQYRVYAAVLAATRPDYTLFLAVPQGVAILAEPLGQLVLQHEHINTIEYSVSTEDLLWTTR